MFDDAENGILIADVLIMSLSSASSLLHGLFS